jgi:hypothetical protein
MRSLEEQIVGLKRLADLIGESECNTMINYDPKSGDVAYLIAVDTPRASQVVYADQGYDVWAWNPTISYGDLQSTNLSIDAAAKVVVAEYHLAKTARVLQHRKDMTADEVMTILAKGYQKKR